MGNEWRPKDWCNKVTNPYMRYGGESLERQWEIEIQHAAFEDGADAMLQALYNEIGNQRIWLDKGYYDIAIKRIDEAKRIVDK